MTARRTIATVAYVAVLAALLAGAYGMHAQANAAPVQPTWQQPVVTVDDERAVELAQAWGAPFEIVYAATGADITVTEGVAGDRVRGHATVESDGDRITSCAIVVDPELETVALLVHEVGHCLGVGHLYTETSRSVMVKGGVEDREHGSETVTHVDRAALADLYEGNN